MNLIISVIKVIFGKNNEINMSLEEISNLR